tara:strand:+ start:728 stop:1534 length:807 start_codon:yes stop_codon:yes gene_type:complete
MGKKSEKRLRAQQQRVEETARALQAGVPLCEMVVVVETGERMRMGVVEAERRELQTRPVNELVRAGLASPGDRGPVIIRAPEAVLATKQRVELYERQRREARARDEDHTAQMRGRITVPGEGKWAGMWLPDAIKGIWNYPSGGFSYSISDWLDRVWPASQPHQQRAREYYFDNITTLLQEVDATPEQSAAAYRALLLNAPVHGASHGIPQLKQKKAVIQQMLNDAQSESAVVGNGAVVGSRKKEWGAVHTIVLTWLWRICRGLLFRSP